MYSTCTILFFSYLGGFRYSGVHSTYSTRTVPVEPVQYLQFPYSTLGTCKIHKVSVQYLPQWLQVVFDVSVKCKFLKFKYSVNFAVYSILNIVYSTWSPLYKYTGQCTVYSRQCTQFTVYTIYCTVHCVFCNFSAGVSSELKSG